MKTIGLAALAILIVAGLFVFASSAKVDAAPPQPAKDVSPATQSSQTRTAVFGGGCFWAAEEAFDQLEGVVDVVSGYAGGSQETATYEKYSSDGHAEVVEVTYDPSKITYGKLLHVLFTFIDPTQVDGQGPDRGPGYRSAIFYANEDEKALAEAYIRQLGEAKVYDKPIATTIEKLDGFYPAEAYHQDYLKDPSHFNRSYVRNVSIKKVKEVRKAFADDLKDDLVELP